MGDALGWPWAAAFVATVWIETPVIALAGRDVVSIPRAFAQSLGLQLTTHPLLWWSFGALTERLGGYLPALLVAETAVLIVEAALLAWLWRPHRRAAIFAALSANVSSTVIGLLTTVLAR